VGNSITQTPTGASLFSLFIVIAQPGRPGGKSRNSMAIVDQSRRG
jgi:hypothetical protein